MRHTGGAPEGKEDGTGWIRAVAHRRVAGAPFCDEVARVRGGSGGVEVRPWLPWLLKVSCA